MSYLPHRKGTLSEQFRCMAGEWLMGLAVRVLPAQSLEQQAFAKAVIRYFTEVSK